MTHTSSRRALIGAVWGLTITGMIVGTFLTLLVVPVLYCLLETGRQRFNRWRGAPDFETGQGTIRHA